MSVAVGRCRHRLTVLAATDTADSYGATGPSFAAVATRWGSIDDGAGRELYYARQVDPQISCVVTMRYFQGLTTRHKLRDEHGRTLNIMSIGMGDRRRHWMSLACTEEVTRV